MEPAWFWALQTCILLHSPAKSATHLTANIICFVVVNIHLLIMLDPPSSGTSLQSYKHLTRCRQNTRSSKPFDTSLTLPLLNSHHTIFGSAPGPRAKSHTSRMPYGKSHLSTTPTQPMRPYAFYGRPANLSQPGPLLSWTPATTHTLNSTKQFAASTDENTALVTDPLSSTSQATLRLYMRRAAS